MTEQRTTVLYESPHRIVSTLKEMCDIIGTDRRIALCRELTKIYEEIVLKPIDSQLENFQIKPPRGEYVMVLEGADHNVIDAKKKEAWADISVKEHVDRLIAEGMDRKAAIKKVAVERGSTRNEIYSAYEYEKTAPSS